MHHCHLFPSPSFNLSSQNSGVTLVSEALHVSSRKDKNPLYARMSYYGVIEDIWEVYYVGFTVAVFRCKWADNYNGVRTDDPMGFTLVNLNREGFKGEPFILASQAKQVFYISDPCDEHWSVVLHGKQHHSEEGIDTVAGEGIDADAGLYETPPFSSGLPELLAAEEDRKLDTYILRDDHNEGLWIDEQNVSSKRRKKS